MEENTGCVSTFFDDNSSFESPHKLSTSSIGVPETSPSTTRTTIDSDSDVLSLPQLTPKEPERIRIQPFYNISPRPLPQSPHYIIEDEFSANPWAMLVATIFLTKTSGKTARPYMKGFFEEYPTPYHVLTDTPSSLERFFENLGLIKRGQMIWKLSYQFISAKWRRASDLCGIGKYGEDAYRIFCLAHLEVDPDDRYLRLYLDWLQQQTDFMGHNGIMDCECVIKDPVLDYYSFTLRNNML